MRQIELTQDKVAVVDDCDFESLNKHNWCASRSSYTYYALRSIKVDSTRTTIAMHQEIMNPPSGMDVDHIDGDKLNNQRSNLRVCEHRQNIRNQVKRYGSSEYKGVSWDKVNLKWFASIRVDGIAKTLGRFSSEVEAAKAYNTAALRFFKEFANLNVVTEEVNENSN